MKVTIFNAMTIDGFIAAKNGDTSWVRDWDEYNKTVEQYDAVIYGRRTYGSMIEAETPMPQIDNFVFTSTPSEIGTTVDSTSFVNDLPANIIKDITSKGFTNILIAGGSRTNAAFLNSGVVNEVIINIHPLILGDGIKLFNSQEVRVKLKKIGQKNLHDDILQIKYKVIKV